MNLPARAWRGPLSVLFYTKTSAHRRVARKGDDVDIDKEMLLRLVKQMPGRFFAKDRESRYLACNTLFANDGGTTTHEIAGKRDRDLAWAEFADKFVSDDREVIESEEPKLGIRESVVNAERRRFEVITDKVPLHDDAGQVIGLIGVSLELSSSR